MRRDLADALGELEAERDRLKRELSIAFDAHREATRMVERRSREAKVERERADRLEREKEQLRARVRALEAELAAVRGVASPAPTGDSRISRLEVE